MSVAELVSPEDVAAAERWHQWQMRSADASRRSARQARIAFTVVLAGLGAWFGLQLLTPSLWP